MCMTKKELENKINELRSLKALQLLEGSKSMSKLQHLFKVGQNVKCRIDGIMQKGIVTEVHDDHIIVDIPEINNHCWFEEGLNLDCVYPIYNF